MDFSSQYIYKELQNLCLSLTNYFSSIHPCSLGSTKVNTDNSSIQCSFIYNNSEKTPTITWQQR